MAKELSSSRPTGLSSLENGWMLQWSVPSTSHGLGLSCCNRHSPPLPPVLPSHSSISLLHAASIKDGGAATSVHRSAQSGPVTVVYWLHRLQHADDPRRPPHLAALPGTEVALRWVLRGFIHHIAY
jgi:hypothetical protein